MTKSIVFERQKNTMRFTNHTNLDDATLRDIIRFCHPAGVTGFDIAFKNSSNGYKGRAYSNGCGYHDASAGVSKKWRKATTRSGQSYFTRSRPYVVIGVYRMPKQHQGNPGYAATKSKGHGIPDSKWTSPYRYAGGNGYLPVSCFSETEAVVHLVAHELRHLWQAKVLSGRRVWGSRGQYSERDADAYAIQLVRQWRRR